MIYFGSSKLRKSEWPNRSRRGAIHHILPFLLWFFCMLGARAADPAVDGLLNQAQLAQLKGDRTAAIALTTQAIELQPTNAQAFYVRGRLYAGLREPAKAVADFTRALQLEPRGAEIYQLRGLELFKLAQFTAAIGDFDQFLKFVPKQEPYHWHRGIAYYFAGRYEDGRKQFELRQKLGTNTIENAFWHFLCTARSAGLAQARASMLPMREDSAFISRKIYEVFAGKTKPEELLALAQGNYSSTAQLNRQLFSAHLYMALYFEVLGDQKQALAHAQKAAGEYKLDNFMGDVAAIEAELLRKKSAQ